MSLSPAAGDRPNKLMLPTPNLSHLTAEDFKLVYEPAEDTFILLDALDADAERLIEHRPCICVEIGSGSGCVSVFAQQLLRCIPTLHFCVDINRIALQATAATFEHNSLAPPNLIQTSLLASLRLDRSIDLLLFNPPYVETEDEEYDQANESGLIAASWAGGSSGMKLTNQLLNSLDQILNPNRGVLYLVAVKENKPEEIVQRMQQSGFVAVVVLRRRAGREHLHVLRISRPDPEPPGES